MTTAIPRPAPTPPNRQPSPAACAAPTFRSPVTGRTDRGPGFQRPVPVDGTAEFRERMQPVLDRLRPYCAGQTVDDAAQRLAQAWLAAAGGKLPADLRTTMATMLAWGERVVLVAAVL